MNIKLKSFPIPEDAIFDLPEGTKISNGFFPVLPLNHIPAEDLQLLCDEWREAVFKLANKTDPNHGRKCKTTIVNL